MYLVTSQASTSKVQSYMNAVEGTEKWQTKNPAWKLLLRSRNNFIKDQLAKLGITPQEYKRLGEIQRLRRLAQLEEAFLKSFFGYSRDGDWMQSAVGENEGWIMIDGMVPWHVRGALCALEKKRVPPPPFDAVKDAIKTNDSTNK